MSSIGDVDHPVVLTNDLEGAADTLSRLGFTVAPPCRHSPNMGTANRCVMFGNDYLELLGIVSDVPATIPLRSMLEHLGPGARGLAFRTPDARAMADEVAARIGVQPPVVELSRPISGGTRSGEAAFAVCMLPGQDELGVQVFGCEHRTPELVWQPDWTSHAIGAVGIDSVVMVAPRPDSLAARFAGLLGPERMSAEPHQLTIHGRTPVRVVTPDGFAAEFGGLRHPAARPTVAGIVLRVRDLSRVEGCIRSAGLRGWSCGSEEWAVQAGAALGIGFRFVAD